MPNNTFLTFFIFRVKLNSIKLLKFQSKKPLNFFLVPMTYSSTISPKFNYLIFKLIITAYRLILPLHRHFFTKVALILRHENQAKNVKKLKNCKPDSTTSTYSAVIQSVASVLNIAICVKAKYNSTQKAQFFIAIYHKTPHISYISQLARDSI